ncbi:MAG: class I SAM-dependent methyltransferase [Candidatus Bathyarchaeota archaeon]|nr:MAG: class I SAM-dependent methyltransferase [Candidatus Bathyarchaeota archaeon]
MSSREKGLARILSRPSYAKRLKFVIERISLGASTILDLGCGVGALTKSLAGKFPSSSIVGVDRSRYLLRELHKKGIAMTVLADIQNLPLREDSFDVAVAVYVLHEIVSSKGTNALIQILGNAADLLRSGGEFVIFDHVNPGDTQILVKLSAARLAKFKEFQAKFKHRMITCQYHGEGLISTSMRDFYDFFTKDWALNSDLEEEEMNETHTPFTRQELQDFILKAGFKIERISSMTPINPREGMTVQSKVKLPDRKIFLLARK